MELIEKRPELHELIEHYIKVVGEFFDSYRFGDDEKKELFEILARPKHYNLIMELRKGPIEKAKIGDILRKGPVVATSINVLGDLQRLDIIDTYTLDGVPWVFLKTDIVIQDSFPEYMQKALPDEDKIAPISGRFDFRLLGPGDEVGILREAFFPPRPESKEPVGRSPASRDIASEDVMDESNQSTFEADTAFDEIVDKISEKYDEKNNQRRNENDEGQIRN